MAASPAPSLDWVDAVESQFRRVIVGQQQLFRRLIQGLLTGNHVLIEGLPGLGPIFANIVLAGEINRAPAKVQSALLEAMQESARIRNKPAR